MGFNTNTTNNDEWLTPPHIISALGDFDLDPCSPIVRPWDTAREHYTKIDEGLSMPWFGRVWLNPPYGREVFAWLNRLSTHKKGIALIFARTETKGFHSEIWGKAHGIFFFKGRVVFHMVCGAIRDRSNAPSCLVSYGDEDTLAIKRAVENEKIQGKLILLRQTGDVKNDI